MAHRPYYLRALFLTLALATPGSAVAQKAVPEAVRSFARSVPNFFSRMDNLVAREEMTQTVLRRGRLIRHRVIVSDYQIAHLDLDPDTRWEFRFVREVDGSRLKDSDRRIEDFLLLRHPDAREERISIVKLAIEKSLPNCYWHNLTLLLGAFGESLLDNYEWTEKSEAVHFRQVRGPGIPEDFFRPDSPRHYPDGAFYFSGPERSLSRIDVGFQLAEYVIQMRLTFSEPAPPDSIALPKLYEVSRRRVASGELVSQTTFRYSDFRRFTVATEEKTGEVKPP